MVHRERPLPVRAIRLGGPCMPLRELSDRDDVRQRGRTDPFILGLQLSMLTDLPRDVPTGNFFWISGVLDGEHTRRSMSTHTNTAMPGSAC